MWEKTLRVHQGLLVPEDTILAAVDPHHLPDGLRSGTLRTTQGMASTPWTGALRPRLPMTMVDLV